MTADVADATRGYMQRLTATEVRCGNLRHFLTAKRSKDSAIDVVWLPGLKAFSALWMIPFIRRIRVIP